MASKQVAACPSKPCKIHKPKIVRENRGRYLPIFINDYTVIDIEATGFKTYCDEIIEVAAIRVVSGKIVDKFSTLVRPKGIISEEIIELTGITNQMVKRAPKISKVLTELLDFIGDSVIVGHGVDFDINFLYDVTLRYKNKVFVNDFICTQRLTDRLFPEIKKSLANLAEEFNLKSGIFHRAEADCELTHLLYQYVNNYVKCTEESDIEALKAKLFHVI